MRVVIDTNVLVSAAVTGRNPEVVILFIIANFEWVVSAEILTEYKEVLSRSRLKLAEEQRERWFNILNTATTLIEVNVDINFPRDRKDANLASAVAAEADFLITGDRDFIEPQMLNTAIISGSLFKRLFCDIRE